MNASLVRRWGRPDRQYKARITATLLMAGNYAKIEARPKGQYYAIVAHFV
jgi:hypothetical protein